MSPNNNLKGAMLTAVGILILSPDILLLRLIGADLWTLLFWRGLLCAIGMLGIILVIGSREGIRRLITIRKPEIQIISVNAVMHIFFVLAVQETSAANTLVIMSISPLFGAILSVLVLREKVANRTWYASTAVFIGLAIIFSQSLVGGTIIGDASALLVSILLATNFVLLRRYRSISMIPAVGWSMFVTALIAWPLATPMSMTGLSWVFMILLGLAILPISTALITLGPRYLPAPEVGLIMLVEPILGPLWVWLVIDEFPSIETLIGGATILITLTILSIRTITQNKNTVQNKLQ
ncbi:MAG: EamA family transporter [Acidiferrobacteraceae bacterium]|nr:EamA family transporter [Acidiferrobacteraceae bacterium]